MSSGRIEKTFQRLKAEGRGGFIAYITAGDPSPSLTLPILHALDAAGTDIIELGIPFSDPLADGPTIQAASGRALAAGMTVAATIQAVRDFRATSQTPIVLFTYLNPIYTFGFGAFVAAAAKAGADGLLVLDMPPEEEAANLDLVSGGGLLPIRLVAPTTPPARMKQICGSAGGFLYYVSREGVTGERAELSETISAQVQCLRACTSLPIAVGFGISTPTQAASVAAQADAAVVGSAIVRTIGSLGNCLDLPEQLEAFVRPLASAAHSARATRP
jgi:tryptophan synthase alpha chain